MDASIADIPYNRPLPQRLRALMEKRTVTQKALAEKVGIKRQTVSSYMNGDAEPPISKARKIAEFFDVSLDYLSGGSECTSQENEKIHELLGLSDASITKLKELNDQGRPGAIGELPYGPYVIEAINALLTHKAGIEVLGMVDAFMDAIPDKLYLRNGEPVDILDLYDGDGTPVAHVPTENIGSAILMQISGQLMSLKEEMNEHVNQKNPE